MAQTLMAACALVALIVKGAYGEWGRSANLGDSVELAASETCMEGEMELIRTLESDSSFVRMARGVGGVWQPEKGYEGRIDHLSASAVRLAAVNYDDDGSYEFLCLGRAVTRIQLTVVSASEVSASEGEAARLPCRAATAGAPARRIRWAKNGELVLEQDRSSGGIVSGDRYEGRVSVSSDWDLTGDLSLTLKEFEPQDQGEFICQTVDEEEKATRGNPGAVRVKLTQRPADENHIGPRTIISITATGLFGLVVFWLWRKSRRAGRGRRPSGNEDDINPPEILIVGFVRGGTVIHRVPRDPINYYD